MQGPPNRRTPPILFMRPTHEWISRVDQKQKQLAAIELPAEEKERLDRWAETEFVCSTLQLEGVDVPHETAARLVSFASLDTSLSGGEDSAVASLLLSLRAVESVTRAEGRSAELSSELLVKIHGSPGFSPEFRTGAGDTSRGFKPVSPEHLPGAVEAACRWFSVDSFAELHPVEQAAIVLLRLMEIQPFEEASHRCAVVAASLFTLRRELPPLIITPEMRPAYRNAIDEGIKMNTKPMVELVAEAVEHSLAGIIVEATRSS